MMCYFCHLGRGPGGTNLQESLAVGICSGCSVGICSTHGLRDLNGKLCCIDCALKRDSSETHLDVRAPAESGHE
jgi:hypothetical protein